jgi:carbon-monoxide dehydrogenase medium subunit
MTRQRTLERDAAAAAACPLLAAATRLIGHAQIRNRGTIGGSVAHADPAAEYPAVAVALRAQAVVRGPAGERVVPAEELFAGPLMTTLEPGELLVELRLPAWGRAAAFEELATRRQDFAIAGVAVALDLDGGRVTRAGVGLAGVGPTALRAGEAEALLEGEKPGREVLAAAARAAAAAARPTTDVHADADYRRALVETLTLRALTKALA